ncbi:hypothetical protein METP2_02272 [Methanosarcinales archaeon]|nr:hypothetical protein METP2_02272 [Methanosarcinales archaeon]
MRFRLFAAVMLFASLFSGCVSNNAYIGTYKLDKTPSKTLELREMELIFWFQMILNLLKKAFMLNVAPL